MTCDHCHLTTWLPVRLGRLSWPGQPERWVNSRPRTATQCLSRLLTGQNITPHWASRCTVHSLPKSAARSGRGRSRTATFRVSSPTRNKTTESRSFHCKIAQCPSLECGKFDEEIRRDPVMGFKQYSGDAGIHCISETGETELMVWFYMQ